MLATRFARLLSRTLALSGSAAATTDSTDLARIRVLIAGRVRAAWEHYWWPELMLCEARPYRPAYAAATTYAEAAEVYYPTTGLYYTALGTTTGHAPTDTAYWSVLTEIDPPEVPYTDTDLEPIGRVRQVSATSPEAAAGARKLPFSLTATGILLIGETVPFLPYVWYLLRCPDFFGADYSAEATYAVGDQIYYASGSDSYEGDYWECLVATSAGESPQTTAASWLRLEVPAAFTETIAYGAAADLYRAAGKTDLAPYLEDKAETALLREQTKLMTMQAQEAGSRRSLLNTPSYAVSL